MGEIQSGGREGRVRDSRTMSETQAVRASTHTTARYGRLDDWWILGELCLGAMSIPKESGLG